MKTVEKKETKPNYINVLLKGFLSSKAGERAESTRVSFTAEMEEGWDRPARWVELVGDVKKERLLPLVMRLLFLIYKRLKMDSISLTTDIVVSVSVIVIFTTGIIVIIKQWPFTSTSPFRTLSLSPYLLYHGFGYK